MGGARPSPPCGARSGCRCRAARRMARSSPRCPRSTRGGPRAGAATPLLFYGVTVWSTLRRSRSGWRAGCCSPAKARLVVRSGSADRTRLLAPRGDGLDGACGDRRRVAGAPPITDCRSVCGRRGGAARGARALQSVLLRRSARRACRGEPRRRSARRPRGRGALQRAARAARRVRSWRGRALVVLAARARASTGGRPRTAPRTRVELAAAGAGRRRSRSLGVGGGPDARGPRAVSAGAGPAQRAAPPVAAARARRVGNRSRLAGPRLERAPNRCHRGAPPSRDSCSRRRSCCRAASAPRSVRACCTGDRACCCRRFRHWSCWRRPGAPERRPAARLAWGALMLAGPRIQRARGLVPGAAEAQGRALQPSVCAGSRARVILTTNPFLGQQLAPLWKQKTILLALDLPSLQASAQGDPARGRARLRLRRAGGLADLGRPAPGARLLARLPTPWPVSGLLRPRRPALRVRQLSSATRAPALPSAR